MPVIVHEETGKEREVKWACKRCVEQIQISTGRDAQEIHESLLARFPIVSRYGFAHAESGTEFTLCGINASGSDWWWKL